MRRLRPSMMDGVQGTFSRKPSEKPFLIGHKRYYAFSLIYAFILKHDVFLYEFPFFMIFYFFLLLLLFRVIQGTPDPRDLLENYVQR